MIHEYVNSDIIKKQLVNLKQIVFEVTDACNLNCTYCTYGNLYNDYDKRSHTMLSIEKATMLIDYFIDLWKSEKNSSAEQVVYVSFYGGEPLLNMHFIKSVVKYINNSNCPHRKFRFSMTTNALLLDKYIDYLKENNFILLISLDGNKDNNGYRIDHKGKSSFDKIKKNIDTLKKKFPDYFDSNVGFNAVIHDKNSVEEIYSFFKDTFNKIPRIGELSNSGISEDKIEEFNHIYKSAQDSLQKSKHYSQIENDMFMETDIYKKLALYLHQCSGFVFKDYTDLLFDTKKTILPTGTCIPFSKKMFITVNGKILPCERIGHRYAWGVITDHIELNLDYIAQKFNAYLSNFENTCKNCANKITCTQCLYNVKDFENRPICDGYTSNEGFNKMVNDLMHFLEKNPESYERIMKNSLIM